MVERYAWHATILPGKLDEYMQLYHNIWPELRAVFAAAGIHNYSIWHDGDKLFGYYECNSVKYAAMVLHDSPVVAQWKQELKSLLDLNESRPMGYQKVMDQRFFFD